VGEVEEAQWEENVEIVRAMYDAFNEGEGDGEPLTLRLSGNYKVPLLVLDNGTIIDGSQNIIEWALTNEAAGLSE
jgi:hypothetical protein